MMRVLRVAVEAPVCSFRQPHFIVGRQLSFWMPPPSTIYGHVASALGFLPDPTSFRFAYVFRARARGDDLEHQHFLGAAGGRARFDARGEVWSKSVEGSIQPVHRSFLFDARLELYLDRPEWESAFRSPAFTVVLGRSQDLADVVDVSIVELERRAAFYLEDTILPVSLRRRTARGTTMLMPLYVAPAPRRDATFAQQILLRGRVRYGQTEESTDDMVSVAGEALDAWVDPTSAEEQSRQRGLIFQSFVPS